MATARRAQNHPLPRRKKPDPKAYDVLPSPTFWTNTLRKVPRHGQHDGRTGRVVGGLSRLGPAPPAGNISYYALHPARSLTPQRVFQPQRRVFSRLPQIDRKALLETPDADADLDEVTFGTLHDVIHPFPRNVRTLSPRRKARRSVENTAPSFLAAHGLKVTYQRVGRKGHHPT